MSKTSTKVSSYPRVDVFREEGAEGRVLEEVSRAEWAVDVVDAREEEVRRGRAQGHDPGRRGAAIQPIFLFGSEGKLISVQILVSMT